MTSPPAMFVFEIVVETVNSYVESKVLVIKSDFGDVFSLELKDPKSLHIVMPEPPPLPPEPAGKKGKKAKKPKPKKGKKGKKGAVEAPPPEPAIQSGQSLLFCSSAPVLLETMKKCPLEFSLWNKDEHLIFIGSTRIPWDPLFTKFLELICHCREPPPVSLREEYNIFNEMQGKLMAKLGIEIKLSHMGEKITTAFRTLSEDPVIKKLLYTGMNSKTTSFMCTMKPIDEEVVAKAVKPQATYVKVATKPVAFADFRNAPPANLTSFGEDNDYCCAGNADKPPDSIYRAPETVPDIDFIIDYVRKIILSCNDNMRMLTPRSIISPVVKSTDMDRFCVCEVKDYPPGQLAERFKKAALKEPCPVCRKEQNTGPGGYFDIANIRGPCGRADCRIARDMRSYIQKLVEEDKKEITINDIIGPCGSKDCSLAEKLQQFLRHEGIFSEGKIQKGLTTQCACVDIMQKSFMAKDSEIGMEEQDVESAPESSAACQNPPCPEKKSYNVYYFTVEYDFEKSPKESKDSKKSTPAASPAPSKGKVCPSDCVSMKDSKTCTKSTCSSHTPSQKNDELNFVDVICPMKEDFGPSPADSNIVVTFDEIHHPCCMESCEVAEKVKEIIIEGAQNFQRKSVPDDDPCYCDCECTFQFTSKTTYCGVCGGYQCLGKDVEEMPMYARPHPCPVYHKLYDKEKFGVQSPFPEKKDEPEKPPESSKGSKAHRAASSAGRIKPIADKKAAGDEAKTKKTTRKSPDKEKEKKKVVPQEKETQDSSAPTAVVVPLHKKYAYPAVPKNMGWNWTAENVPGMKPRPKTWKPGAVHKILARRYRSMREGTDVKEKKKRAMMQRKKKLEMKPTITVTKHDGEFTVQMEVLKKYSKERMLYQYPYDEKPPLVYTIGKTDAERAKLKKQRERRERRDTRRKCKLLQSTFRDRCQEICVKAYNQALGLLPLPNAEAPDCPCRTASAHTLVTPPIDSCSCSDEGEISSSDTDGDDWVIEFSPPVARWNPKAKHLPVLVENESQYTYLDYKVKLLDKKGNPVPRYFKGPDGKQECSDLGGFWGPGHHWLEINKDGYIGPDSRWVPSNFTGPDGMLYSSDEGFFLDNNGNTLTIGVDGYIDKDGNWAWYSGKRKTSGKSKQTSPTPPPPRQHTTDTKANESHPPAHASKPHHTADKPASANPNTATPSKGKATGGKSAGKTAPGKGGRVVVGATAVHFTKKRQRRDRIEPLYVDMKKLNRYKEIMQTLGMYEDLGEIGKPVKTNRASNTPMNIHPSTKRFQPATPPHEVRRRHSVSPLTCTMSLHQENLATALNDSVAATQSSSNDMYSYSESGSAYK